MHSKMTRQEQNQFQIWKRAFSLVCVVLMVLLAVCLLTISDGKDCRQEEAELPVIAKELSIPESHVECWEAPDIQEDYENQQIEEALLEKAMRIDNCTVTWYTANTCGKKPGDAAYGITYSGLPVVEHQTCAVDKSVIPLYSDVFVQYADGTIEQLWATDTGVRGNSLDIYTPDYDYAMQCGRQKLTVWFVPPEG